MQIHIFSYRKLLQGLILILALGSTIDTLRAEGTKQVAPTAPTDGRPPVMLQIEDDDFGNFGTEDGSRLFFSIKEAGEVIHLGLSNPFDEDGDVINGSYDVRIFREGNGTPVASFTITNNSGGSNANVLNYDQSEFGMYSDDFTYTATEAGDYYIVFELDVVSPNAAKDFYIGYWDFTVTDINDAVVPGRVWSRNWAFRTPSNIDDLGDDCGWNRAFDGKLFSYTDEAKINGFVTEIDFSGAEFQGLSFNVAFNSRGPGGAGEPLEEARQSRTGNATDNTAEYRVFLNEPDPEVFPSDVSLCGEITVSGDIGCPSDSLFCVDVTVTQPGQVEMILDFNNDGVLNPDDQFDVSYVFQFATAGTQCLEFPAVYADGSPIAFGDDFTLLFTYSQGVQHYAAFDVEFLKSGFCIETIRPICEPDINSVLNQATRFLYWDDRNIADDPLINYDGMNPPKDGRIGYLCSGEIQRRWDNFGLGGQTCLANGKVPNDGNTTGYGDKNTLNTWWFGAVDTAQIPGLTLLDCMIDADDAVCTATLAADVVGNNAPFTYSWSGPNGFTAMDSVITVSEAGEYNLTVTDASGCTTTCSTVLDALEGISCDVDGPDMICPGESTSYSAVVTGNDGPFTFSWTGPNGFSSTDSTIVVSEAGEYCATVTATNGCETTCCQTLSFFEEMTCAIEGPTTICVGDIATYTVAITNGQAPFTYSWTGPNGFSSADESVDVSEAGEYCATITDANGCTTECCQTLGFFAELSCTVDGPATICVGDTATYSVSLTNGQAPFTYSWTGPNGFSSADESILVFEAGEYCATVTDANGCETTCCQTLSFVDEITCTIDGPDTICEGETATYTVVASDGVEPYTYIWTGPNGFSSTDQSIMISEAGEYCAVVTDANGCSTECCKTLNVSPVLSCEVDGPSMICIGDVANYSATVTGGVGPFSYSWTGPNGFSSTDENITVSEEGEYCVVITDASDCTTECCQTLSFFPEMTCTIDGPLTICVGDTATYGVSLLNGQAPFNYEWTGPNGFSSTDESILVFEAGEYCATVTDANGCETTCCQTLSFIDEITCEIEGPDMICVGDSATYTVNALQGAPPFDYVWTGPNGFSSTDQTITISEAGEYCAMVTDANGCSTECCQTLSFFPDLSCEVEGPTMICVGDTATYTATVTGGQAPFNYEWTGPNGFSSTDESIMVFEAGEYCTTITDDNGCTTECCQTLSFFPEISCELVGPSTICVGDTATYTVVVTGGEGPFDIEWTGPNGFSSTDESIMAFEAGEYCAMVTDANGCSTECCQTLDFIDEITCEIEGPDMICVGETATYTVNALAGQAPFSYAWTGPNGFISTEQSITISEAGEYCAMVVDANGCSTECCKTLSFFPDLSCEVEGPDVICAGDTATYTVSVTGGTAPFTYDWTGPNGFTSTDESIMITEGGEYCAMVTDDNGCTTTCCKTLTISDEITCEVEGPDMICVGDTATYSVSILGGAAPFTYSWTGPNGFSSTDESIMVFEGGEYCVVVTDAGGCTTECCQTLGFFPDLSCEVEGPDMICPGETATYTANVTGGTEPFSYNWTGPNGFSSSDESVTVSDAGEYCVVITDANGCMTECCQTLSLFPDLSCTIEGDDTVCAGEETTFTVVPMGGAEPFTVEWTGPNNFMSTELSITISEAGEYCATVTDANGCTTECCQTLTVIDNLSCEVEGPEVICPGDETTYTAVITGGQIPFTYSWTGPGGLTSTEASVIASEAGEYCVVVTDGNGCTTECCKTLSFFEEISCEVEGPDMVCPGETATYTASIPGGTGPFTFSWVGPNGFTSTDESITVGDAGEYCATITDGNGCMTTCCKTLSFFEEVSCMVEGTDDPICFGETTVYTASATSGTGPFTISWTGPDGFTADGESITIGVAGEYCATVTDSNGCTSICCKTLEVIQIEVELTADPTEVELGGDVTLMADATGCVNCVYIWSGPGLDTTTTVPEITITPGLPLPDNNEYTYTVVVSENGLCPAEASVTITVITFCDPEHIYIPNAFTPNGDQMNDVLRVRSNTLELFEVFELLIYNRWGEEMFRTTNSTDAWDGTYRGEDLPPDVYGYYLRVICPSGEELVQKGNITLLR